MSHMCLSPIFLKKFTEGLLETEGYMFFIIYTADCVDLDLIQPNSVK